MSFFTVKGMFEKKKTLLGLASTKKSFVMAKRFALVKDVLHCGEGKCLEKKKPFSGLPRRREMFEEKPFSGSPRRISPFSRRRGSPQ